MKRYIYYLTAAVVPVIMAVSCEIVDDDPTEHVDEKKYVELGEVAKVLAVVPIQMEHLEEVHDAVSASSYNGYDEEYTMKMLFESPGKGVGDSMETRQGTKYEKPLRELIHEHVLSTKSSALKIQMLNLFKSSTCFVSMTGVGSSSFSQSSFVNS